MNNLDQAILGVVMDPLNKIKAYKDSTFAMLLEAQRRDWRLRYIPYDSLFLQNGQVWAHWQDIRVTDDRDHWFDVVDEKVGLLSDCDVILMRKDPPFNMEYIYTTYLLELVEQAGVLVVNKAESLRSANEKLFTAWFPQCCVPTLVTKSELRIRQFLKENEDIILKPLDRMGGASIFRVTLSDPNVSVILEEMTENGARTIMAQKFIPDIEKGDKRILLIDGEPVPYALARVPQKGETRGNLAVGGKAIGMALSERDRWVCEQLGAKLKSMGLMFVGIDVIGDYLTEINVTSPTCIRELDEIYSLNIAGILFDAIDKRLSEQSLRH